MQKYATQDAANAGNKLPLKTPDGKPTDEYLLVRSFWSEEYQALKNRALQHLIEERNNNLTQDQIDSLVTDRQIALSCSLVAGWNLKDDDDKPLPFNPENVEKLLRIAPQIRQQIDVYAGNDADFFADASMNFTNGQSG